jgi:hypothetical protein
MSSIRRMKWSEGGIFCIHLSNARELKFASLSQDSLWATFIKPPLAGSAIFIKGKERKGIWQHGVNRKQSDDPNCGAARS